MDEMRRTLCRTRGTSWSQAEAKGRERDEEKGREGKGRERDEEKGREGKGREGKRDGCSYGTDVRQSFNNHEQHYKESLSMVWSSIVTQQSIMTHQ